jgi:hypothetical protein
MAQFQGRQIHLECNSCLHRFEVAKTMAGGMTNCPKCQQLLEISGTPDAFLYWGCVAFVGLICGLICVGFVFAEAYLAAMIAFFVGALIVGICVAAS